MSDGLSDVNKTDFASSVLSDLYEELINKGVSEKRAEFFVFSHLFDAMYIKLEGIRKNLLWTQLIGYAMMLAIIVNICFW